jgi:hypothetical protein
VTRWTAQRPARSNGAIRDLPQRSTNKYAHHDNGEDDKRSSQGSHKLMSDRATIRDILYGRRDRLLDLDS